MSDENLEYLKSKAREMKGSLDEVMDRALKDCYLADKEKNRKTRRA